MSSAKNRSSNGIKAAPLIFLSLIAALMLSLSLGLHKCSTDSDEVEIRNGIAYAKGSKQVFNGYVVTRYTDERGRKSDKIYEEGDYSFGRKNGVWITNKWDGGRKEEEYRLGKLEGKVVEYHRNGNKSHEQMYRNGVADGPGAYFDFDGEIARVVFYRNGTYAPELSQGSASNITPEAMKKWVDSMNQGFLKGERKEDVFSEEERARILKK